MLGVKCHFYWFTTPKDSWDMCRPDLQRKAAKLSQQNITNFLSPVSTGLPSLLMYMAGISTDSYNCHKIHHFPFLGALLLSNFCLVARITSLAYKKCKIGTRISQVAFLTLHSFQFECYWISHRYKKERLKVLAPKEQEKKPLTLTWEAVMTRMRGPVKLTNLVKTMTASMLKVTLAWVRPIEDVFFFPSWPVDEEVIHSAYRNQAGGGF